MSPTENKEEEQKDTSEGKINQPISALTHSKDADYDDEDEFFDAHDEE